MKAMPAAGKTGGSALLRMSQWLNGNDEWSCREAGLSQGWGEGLSPRLLGRGGELSGVHQVL